MSRYVCHSIIWWEPAGLQHRQELEIYPGTWTIMLKMDRERRRARSNQHRAWRRHCQSLSALLKSPIYQITNQCQRQTGGPTGNHVRHIVMTDVKSAEPDQKGQHQTDTE